MSKYIPLIAVLCCLTFGPTVSLGLDCIPYLNRKYANIYCHEVNTEAAAQPVLLACQF